MAPNPTISPKVKASGAVSAIVVVLIAMLAAITPDMVDFAGQFTPVIYAGIVALAAVLGGYVKSDPDRDLPDAGSDF